MANHDDPTDDISARRRESAMLVQQVRELKELVRSLKTAESSAPVLQEIQQLQETLVDKETCDRCLEAYTRNYEVLQAKNKILTDRVNRVHAVLFESGQQTDSVMARLKNIERQLDLDEDTNPRSRPSWALQPPQFAGKWQFFMAMVPGILGLMTAVAAYILWKISGK
jgi:hypothetical protein